MIDSEVKATHSHKKKSKKRVKEDVDCSTREKHVNSEGEMQELDAELDMSGPTMAEKLASLELLSDGEAKNATEKEAPPSTNIPSVDSVHVLLKQAIHAEDHALLVDCLSTTDEKVITKSTALLNPSDVLKFLKSLLSMIELRGTVLIRALPWLRSLLNQHASCIASQESSLIVLNSLYQYYLGPVDTALSQKPSFWTLPRRRNAGLLVSLFNQGLQHTSLLFNYRLVWIVYLLRFLKLTRVLLEW